MNQRDINNKPTILLGAGAVIEIGAPTTNDITQDIIKPQKYVNYARKSSLEGFQRFSTIARVYDRLKNKYPQEPNFEQIFHVLEMLDAYKWVWFKDCKNIDTYPVFAPFVVPETNIVSHDEWDNLSFLIDQCQVDIMQKVNAYDEEYKKKKDTTFQWYRDFWSQFNDFDLFNLNYDTTIEQSLQNYCDGFVNSDDIRFQKFQPKLLNNEEFKYKICHLHGCILYYYQRYKDIRQDVYEYKHHDMYKWNDFKTVNDMLQCSSNSNSSNQSGETLHIGSILTGLRKNEKITVIPYHYYYHYLNTAILRNKSLLIVGYSFGDLYINDLIERMNLLYGKEKRIVVITKLEYDKYKDSCNGYFSTFGNKDFDNNYNDNELLFIKRMMHDDSFELRCLEKTIQNEGPYTSKDGDVKLFVYGFKSAVEKHGDEILEFLSN